MIVTPCPRALQASGCDPPATPSILLRPTIAIQSRRLIVAPAADDYKRW